MKGFLILVFVLFQSLHVFAQHDQREGCTIREIQFPLTEDDTTTVFLYFNDEWIPGVDIDMVEHDSISKLDIVKDYKYGNPAVFFTVSPSYLSQLKSKVDEMYKGLSVNYDPICEFPGGNRVKYLTPEKTPIRMALPITFIEPGRIYIR